MMPAEVCLPVWDLRGCSPPGLAAIQASCVRERVFWLLKERNLDLSWLTLSQLAIVYDQARWWIEQQERACACLQRLLDLRAARAQGHRRP